MRRGLFDRVRCDAELPGDPPQFVKDGRCEFQTKDFDCPHLETYVITADGRLLDPKGEEMHYHGDVDFYTSNTRGAHPELGWFTEDGSDMEWVVYTARFTNGRLERITEAERRREPARPISEYPRS